MPDLSRKLEPIPRRALHVFYILDTSGSLRLERGIQRLNRAMESTIDALRQVAQHNGNALVKVAVMEYNSNVRWINPDGPQELDQFVWQDLTAAGMTYVGLALRELDSKLSRDAFLKSDTGAFLPVIVFMTDGKANDDYQPALDEILKNRWFRQATRVGFAIGQDPDTEMIAKLAGDSEAVIRTDDLGIFARLLRFASVTASTLASTTHTISSAASGAEAVRQALEDANVPRAIVDPGFAYLEDVRMGGSGIAGGEWSDDDW